MIKPAAYELNQLDMSVGDGAKMPRALEAGTCVRFRVSRTPQMQSWENNGQVLASSFVLRADADGTSMLWPATKEGASSSSAATAPYAGIDFMSVKYSLHALQMMIR